MSTEKTTREQKSAHEQYPDINEAFEATEAETLKQFAAVRKQGVADQINGLLDADFTEEDVDVVGVGLTFVDEDGVVAKTTKGRVDFDVSEVDAKDVSPLSLSEFGEPQEFVNEEAESAARSIGASPEEVQATGITLTYFLNHQDANIAQDIDLGYNG